MDYTSLENERLNLYAAYKKRKKIGILILLGAIGLIALGVLVKQVSFFAIVGVVALIVGIVFLGLAGSKASDYSKRNKPRIVKAMLDDLYPGSTYNPNGGIPLAEIFNSGLIVKHPDRYHMEDLLQGVYNNVQFTTCDVKLEEKREYRDSQGHRRVEWITYFKGRWYEFQYERNLGQIIRIKEKALFKEMITKGLTKCEVESIEFTDKFMVFSSNPEALFYIVTPVVIEKIVQLEKMHKGKIMFAFINDKLYIGINDNKDYLEIKIKTPINEETMAAYKGQISIIGAIIEEFGLDSNKFKNQEY